MFGARNKEAVGRFAVGFGQGLDKLPDQTPDPGALFVGRCVINADGVHAETSL